jgi:hypothetical protein
MTQGVRYKFIGSSIQVSTGVLGVSPTPAITGIALTDPAIVSTSPQAHGLVTGDVVLLSGIVGPTNFNGNMYPVDDYTSTDFALADEDNTAGDAWVSGGRVDEVSFSTFCELTGANQQDGGADQEEVSTVCSTAKEFEQGLSDTGTLTVDFNFAPLSTVQAYLREAKNAGSKVAFKITLPNSGGTVILIGTVQTTNFSGAVGQAVWKGSATIKLSGPMFVLA